MRDFQFPGRSPVHALNAMVATSQPAATLAALDVLRAGGNAVDAAVAASAVLCVVEPMSTGVGGDCFVLYAPGGGGEIIAYNGSGRAPAAAHAEWFLDNGIDTITEDSVHAVTVPGAIDAWDRLIADHGSKGLDELLRPAIGYAENGYAVQPRVAYDWRNNVAKIEGDETARRIFLPGGAPPGVGDVHRQPELAETLRTIAAEGRDGFYRGRVAEDIVGFLRARGGLHTLDDFAAAGGEYVTPISTNYRGLDIFECPPNGQGIVALIMLNLLAGYDLGALDPVGVERLHLEVEAGRLAFADRDVFVADPALAEVPVERLLGAEHAAELRAHIRRDRAMTAMPAATGMAHRDTIYLCVVDADRNVVSFINSLFHGFGSGKASPRTGVMMQSRGAGFVVEPGHPNCIAPGKRPMHTIIPGMALESGRVVMPFGVMGGNYQPFGHVHFITNLVDYGMDVQEALDCPRVFRYDGALEAERGVSDAVCRGLAALGHPVEACDNPLGGGQAIRIDWQRGVLIGGSEPRKDGLALGY
ncbi:MAG: gamma-glutamyltransferase [Alphaproteobacteria bacterium]